MFDTSMVHPAAGDVPVAHSAARVCVLKKGALSKASRLQDKIFAEYNAFNTFLCFDCLYLFKSDKGK